MSNCHVVGPTRWYSETPDIHRGAGSAAAWPVVGGDAGDRLSRSWTSRECRGERPQPRSRLRYPPHQTGPATFARGRPAKRLSGRTTRACKAAQSLYMKGERVLAKINPAPRRGKSAVPPPCRLFPQEQVYCCTAVCEVSWAKSRLPRCKKRSRNLRH
jgi:hypothetical protein